MIDTLIDTEERIEQIARNVHAIFEREGWEYYDGPPTLDRIENNIRSLYHSAEREGVDQEHGDNCFVETGRIRVQRDYYEGNGGPELTVYLNMGSL